MAKELLKPQQFARAEQLGDETAYRMSSEEQTALAQLYEGTFSPYKRGSIITGTILSIDSDGVLIDINFKSEGLVPSNEFTDHELKKLSVGAPLDVMLDELENAEGLILRFVPESKSATSLGSPHEAVCRRKTGRRNRPAQS